MLALSVASLLISLILAFALLKMQNWSRWVSIAVYAISLVFIPREVIAAHGVPDLVSPSGMVETPRLQAKQDFV